MRRRKREGEEKKQATDFKEALCCTSGIVQGAAQRKNEAECPGYLGPSGRPTAILTQPKRSWRLHHHVEAAVDWSSVYCLRAYYYMSLRFVYVTSLVLVLLISNTFVMSSISMPYLACLCGNDV